MIALANMIGRDFKKSQSIKICNSTTMELINNIYKQFIHHDDYKCVENETNDVYIVDTCSFIKKSLDEFDLDHRYVITCGVFLEILQGANTTTLNNGAFHNDIMKLIQLKLYLQDNLVFLFLGRKRRAYWNGYQPSRSCRNCLNYDNPHFKILRDVDTELFRLAIIMNWKIDTCDFVLNNRIKRYHHTPY